MLRTRISRWLGRRLTGHDVMLCAMIHWRHHPAERLADAIFGAGHCRRCADYEAAVHRRRQGFVDEARRQGWL